MDIYEQVAKMTSKADFIEFLENLKGQLSSNNQEWENNTLESYIEGLYGYCLDSISSSHLTWKMMAEALLAARVYE